MDCANSANHFNRNDELYVETTESPLKEDNKEDKKKEDKESKKMNKRSVLSVQDKEEITAKNRFL